MIWTLILVVGFCYARDFNGPEVWSHLRKLKQFPGGGPLPDPAQGSNPGPGPNDDSTFSQARFALRTFGFFTKPSEICVPSSDYDRDSNQYSDYSAANYGQRANYGQHDDLCGRGFEPIYDENDPFSTLGVFCNDEQRNRCTMEVLADANGFVFELFTNTSDPRSCKVFHPRMSIFGGDNLNNGPRGPNKGMFGENSVDSSRIIVCALLTVRNAPAANIGPFRQCFAIQRISNDLFWLSKVRDPENNSPFVGQVITGESIRLSQQRSPGHGHNNNNGGPHGNNGPNDGPIGHGDNSDNGDIYSNSYRAQFCPDINM